jgi:hypothetical protein
VFQKYHHFRGSEAEPKAEKLSFTGPEVIDPLQVSEDKDQLKSCALVHATK